MADGTAAIHVIGLDLTSAPVPVAGMGTDGTTGVPLTDAINPPALEVSTENFDWGGGYESTYVLNGTILGYSETQEMSSSDTNTS